MNFFYIGQLNYKICLPLPISVLTQTKKSDTSLEADSSSLMSTIRNLKHAEYVYQKKNRLERQLQREIQNTFYILYKIALKY
jgi:hypothetical protein